MSEYQVVSEDQSVSEGRGKAYTRSALVALVLAVLTIIELFVAINLGSMVLLFLIALVKAAIVVHYYMHISRLWNPEGGH